MPQYPPKLDDWTAEVAPQLGLQADTIPIQQLLDLTRDVAHSVIRPAGPLTTYLLGLAVGQGHDPATAMKIINATVEKHRIEVTDVDSDTKAEQ